MLTLIVIIYLVHCTVFLAPVYVVKPTYIGLFVKDQQLELSGYEIDASPV